MTVGPALDKSEIIGLEWRPLVAHGETLGTLRGIASFTEMASVKVVAMANRGEIVFVVGALAVIALASTVISLALQDNFGRSTLLIAVGPAIAVVGVLVFVRISKGGRR